MSLVISSQADVHIFFIQILFQVLLIEHVIVTNIFKKH